MSSPGAALPQAASKRAKKATPAATPRSAAQKALEKLGLFRDIDLALHLPLRYEDETRLTTLAEARDGDTVQVEGEITHSEIAFRPRRQLRVTLNDGTDTCVLRFLNFYPSHQKTLSVGARVRVRGEIRGGFISREMVHPSFKVAGGELPRALTPVYPTVAGLPQAYLRKAVIGGLNRADLSETIPDGPTLHNPLEPAWTLRQALQFLHHPAPDTSLETLEDHSHPAWQRLKLEELLAQQLSQLQARRLRAAVRAPALRQHAGSTHGDLRAQLLERLPFQLTGAQRRVCTEVESDLQRTQPMHRLLQGDVGSGKTVVAALAAARCIAAGYQCALMAPTEILAEQHFRKLVGWLEPLGITTAWLTGSQKTKERREMLALIESGVAGLVVGTHAVIQDKVVFRRLALAIIDEQHRFGVAQRLALRTKISPMNSETSQSQSGTGSAGPQGVAPSRGEAAARSEPATGVQPGFEPHLLMMTATPIPRTLAMSYYADLDVSTIDELPPGRTPVVTKLVNDSRRDEVILRIRTQLAEGRQIYWVCPLIEESEAVDLVNATQTHAALSEALPGVVVGLLHSRMPVLEKKAVMGLFTGGQMGVLVSTTVIEVGVDVPNASLMVIEHAERFGLSQLHQLRGRVGRGAAASACVLLYSTGDAARLGETARARLRAMAETNDGFEIARRDLDIRGPGEFLGARQSGAPLLRFADLQTDAELLAWAREAAPRMLDAHPQLAMRHVSRWLGSQADFSWA
jgi:ATP-dependent DNA helicase RecG